MSKNKIDQWNKRYAESGHLFGAEPNAFMRSQTHLIKPNMRVLAIGDGEAHNSIWLAQNSLNVCSVDSSFIAQQKAKQNALEAGVNIEFVYGDILEYLKAPQKFDLIVHFFVHLPKSDKIKLHHVMNKHLAPQGLILLECFHIEQINFNSGGPEDISMLYSEQDIQTDFSMLKTLFLKKQLVQVYQENMGYRPGATLQYAGLKI